MNIFVAKLNFDTQDSDLREVFEAFGSVDSCAVVMDRMTGRSKGFAFVEMPDDGEAQAAIDALNESELDGRTIVVKKAEPRR
jgi:RNA recognition motif-containing protein